GETGEGDSYPFRRGLPGFRPHFSQRVSGKETQARDRTRDAAPADAAGRAMAEPEAEGGGCPPMETAAQFARRNGAVGHFRPRLAGGPWRTSLSDPYDRRRHKRAAGAVCAERLHRTEHAAAADLAGAPWQTAELLHGQSQPVSQHAEGLAQSEGAASRRTRSVTAHADRPRVAGTEHCLDRGPFTAGERPRRAELRYGAGPAGERPARGGSPHAGGSQSLPRKRVSALVESASGGRTGLGRRGAPAAHAGLGSGGRALDSGNAPGEQRLHHPVPRPVVPHRECVDHRRIARRRGSCREAARRANLCAFPRTLSGSHHHRAASGAGQTGSVESSPDRQTPKSFASDAGGHAQSSAQARNAGVGCRENRWWSCLGPGRLKVKKDRRAKTARRTLAFTKPKASAQKFHRKHSSVPYRKALRAQRAGKPGCHGALGGLAPTAFGANSVASALGFRSGATPFGHVHLNPFPQRSSLKQDISIWQRSGHFYLALTVQFGSESSTLRTHFCLYILLKRS